MVWAIDLQICDYSHIRVLRVQSNFKDDRLLLIILFMPFMVPYVWNSPLDHAPGHFGQGIIVIQLILVDFDDQNANISLKICTYVVYIHVYAVWKV